MADRNKPFLEGHGPEGGLPVPVGTPAEGDREVSNRPEARVTLPPPPPPPAAPASDLEPGSEYSIFYALMFLGVALFCVALPALIIGIVAIAQNGGAYPNSNIAMYVMPATPSPATTPTPGTGVAPTVHDTPAPTAGAHAEVSTHYEYDGDDGPEMWGWINPAWYMCRVGTYQSPIDLVDANTLPPPADLGITPLDMAHFQDVATYVPNNSFRDQAFVSFNGHAITTNSPLASYFTHKNTWYQLLQFHLHTPSEHTIDGKAADAELHMVHQTLTGKLLVIGIMIDAGGAGVQSPPFIASLIKELPAASVKGWQGPAQFQLSITQLLTDIGVPNTPTAFYTYAGSLTTPPCSEGVTWLVLKKRLVLAAKDIQALEQIMGENARPVMPRNNRTVFLAQ